MIFVSFGNVPLDFKRLAKAIDEYALSTKEKIIVQFGNTKYNFKNVEAIDFVSQDIFKNNLIKASVVVMQGGWGGMSEASDLGCRIVAVPRIKGVEHNHDQEQLVRQIEKESIVVGLYDVSELSEKIELAKQFNFKPINRGSATKIINESITKWFTKK